MPREPVLRNTCHGPRTSLPQRSFHSTDRIQQNCLRCNALRAGWLHSRGALRCRCAALRCAGCDTRTDALRAGCKYKRRRSYAFDLGFFSVFFLGWFFLGTLINAHTLPGQTEGLKAGCRFMAEEWVGLRNG